MSKQNKISGLKGFLLKIVLIVLFVFPFYIAICYSFKTKSEIVATGLQFPRSFSLENFRQAIELTNKAGMPYWNTVLNTLISTVAGTLVLTLLSVMASYVLARRRGFVYSVFYSLMILSLLIPIQAYMFPLYTLLRDISLLNTQTGFVLTKVAAQLGFSVIITTGFVKTIPLDIEEAARVDGAGFFATFVRIIFPLMQPIILTSIVINALSIWNDFSIAFITLIKPSKYIISLLQFNFIGSNSSQMNYAFALFTLSMLPILILYFILQKYIIGGIIMGSVKG